MLSKCSTLLAALVCVTLPLSAATVQYSARQDIATGFQHLTGLAVADFNGDGLPDLAATDDYANKVVVYLNNGKGGFGAPVITTLSATGYGGLGSLVAGDVNEDGKPDLIVSPVGGIQTDIVLLGNGDGTFTQGQILSSTYGFINGALVDVNGDKHLDLIGADNPDISIELGDGKGNFNQVVPPGSYGLYFNTGLAVGDFNGDGHLDFLTAAYSSEAVQFTAGNGDGTFQPPSPVLSNIPSSFGFTLSAGDFNRDGKLDFVLSGVDFSAVFLNQGNGVFPSSLNDAELLPTGPAYTGGALPPPPSSDNPPITATADLDGNGALDIAIADDSSQQLSVFLNDGTGKFSQLAPDFTAALDLGSGVIQTADLNGDGLPDIVVTNYKTQNISIFLSVVPKLNPTLTVQSSQTQALIGSSPTITVQVTGSGSTTPTGSITLTSGSTSFGQQALSASGTATFTLQGLSAGQYPLTATYTGDKSFNTATNSTVTQSVTDFQVALPTSTETVPAGSSATFPISLSALDGFTGSVALSCTGLPAGYTCSPLTANLSGTSTTVNLIVSPASVAHLDVDPLSSSAGRPLVALSCLGLIFWAGRRRKLLGGVALSLTLVCLTSITGCSGSGSSKPAPYTGTSNFTVTVSATQGTTTTTHQLAATLVVQ